MYFIISLPFLFVLVFECKKSVIGSSNYGNGCEAIGNGPDDGFFSLRVFKEHLYAGGFGYNLQQFIFRYPPFEPTSPGIVVTESIGRFAVFKDYIYANTENQGFIYRTNDGEMWEKVYDPKHNHTIGCGLSVFQNQLFAVNYNNKDHKNGRIFRSFDGLQWEKVFDSEENSQYVREIVSFQEMIYVFSYDEKTLETGFFESTNGTVWKWVDVPHRLFRGYVWGGSLWIGTSRLGSQSAALLRYDGSKLFEVVRKFEDMEVISDIRYFDNAMFVTSTKQWKGKEGGATVYRQNEQGNWEVICVFEETESWNLEVFDGGLYISTKQDGGKGKLGRLYRLQQTVKQEE